MISNLDFARSPFAPEASLHPSLRFVRLRLDWTSRATEYQEQSDSGERCNSVARPILSVSPFCLRCKVEGAKLGLRHLLNIYTVRSPWLFPISPLQQHASPTEGPLSSSRLDTTAACPTEIESCTNTPLPLLHTLLKY